MTLPSHSYEEEEITKEDAEGTGVGETGAPVTHMSHTEKRPPVYPKAHIEDNPIMPLMVPSEVHLPALPLTMSLASAEQLVTTTPTLIKV
jgi:hypothetical protein